MPVLRSVGKLLNRGNVSEKKGGGKGGHARAIKRARIAVRARQRPRGKGKGGHARAIKRAREAARWGKCGIVIVIPTLDVVQGERVGRLALAMAGCSIPVRVIVVHDERRQGFTKTVNRGMRRAASAEDVCLLNDDVEKFQRGWLEAMRKALYSSSRYGLCGPSGAGIAPMNKGRPGGRGVQVVDRISFWCVLLKREVISKVGLLNEAYIHYASDIVYCHSVKRKGWKCVWAKAVYLSHRHHGSGIQGKWKKHDRRIYRRRR